MPLGKKLTARLVEAEKPPAKGKRLVRDAGCTGLYLQVRSGGARSWIQVLSVDGKRREYGLGRWPEVSLEAARQKVYANRALRDEGRAPAPRGGPLSKGRQTGPARVPTFAAAMVEAIRLNGTNERTAMIWENSLRTYASPLASLPVSDITRADVLGVLKPVWTEKEETARRVKQRIAKVMDWAVANGHRTDNPADGALFAALPRQERETEHRRSLPHAETRTALAAIRHTTGQDASRLAMEFAILTGARSGEARCAAWEEIDLAAKVWTVPAERMKMKRPHTVPLSSGAVRVLEVARGLGDGSGLVFPSAAGKAIGEGTLRALLRRARVDSSPHGFRATLRDWMIECTDAPIEVRRAVLAHEKEDKVQAAYERSDLLERRRPYMEEWWNYLA